MQNNCLDCQHKEICKYRDSYETTLKTVGHHVPEPFTLTLHCSHYATTSAYLNRGFNECVNGCATNTTSGTQTFTY